METIYIFGDSYSREYDYKLYPYVWSNQLKSQFNIVNYGLGGTGPDWSLQKIIDLVNKIKDPINCYLIFCLSNIYRLNYKGFDPTHQFLIPQFFANSLSIQKKRPDIGIEKDLKKLFKKYSSYKLIISLIYKNFLHYSTYHDTEILKIILYTKFITNRFKKVLILPCFAELTNDVLKKINENNFYVHSKPLCQYEKEKIGWHDQRPNHLEESQHIVLYNDILQILNT